MMSGLLSFEVTREVLRSDDALIATLSAALVAVSVTLFLVLPTFTTQVFAVAEERLKPKKTVDRLRFWFRALGVSVTAFILSVLLALLGYFEPEQAWLILASVLLVIGLVLLGLCVVVLSRTLSSIAFADPGAKATSAHSAPLSGLCRPANFSFEGG